MTDTKTNTDWFETATRDNGEEFTKLKSYVPGWVYSWVHAAHEGELPNDWRYDTCKKIVDEWIDRNHDTTDLAVEVSCDHDSDTVTLLRWAADDRSRIPCVDDAIEMGCDTLNSALILAQSQSIEAMADLFVQAVEENWDK